MERRHFINFRVSDSLIQSLDQFVKQQKKAGVKLSRAQAARLLIEQALNGDARAAVLGAALVQAQQAVSKVTSQVSAEMCDRYAVLLEDELRTD